MMKSKSLVSGKARHGEWKGEITKGKEEKFRMMDTFIILIRVIVLWVFKYIKTSKCIL